MSTKIEWCDETINPVQDVIKGESGRGYHCTKCSPGCLNCYAETINNRFGNHLPFDGRKVDFEIVESELHKLAKWKKPRSIFVQSMGDLFHEDVSVEFIAQVYFEMNINYQHTYLMLTKRADRMAEIINLNPGRLERACNLYGLTICNQQEADEKIPTFLKVPGKKFLSIEPCLGKIDISKWLPQMVYNPGMIIPERETFMVIDAVILGGETGPKARPMKPDWVRSVQDQCQAAGVPFFFKSWGEFVSSYDAGFRSEEQDRWKRTFGKAWVKSRRSCRFEDGTQMVRVGKKAAGRILDGRTHDDLPWVKK